MCLTWKKKHTPNAKANSPFFHIHFYLFGLQLCCFRMVHSCVIADHSSRSYEPRVRVPLEESPVERQVSDLAADRRQACCFKCLNSVNSVTCILDYFLGRLAIAAFIL